MKFEDVEKTVSVYLKHGLVEEIAAWLLRVYDLEHPNFGGFAFREIAKPDYILLTAEGEIGSKQTIRIPENLFSFPLQLILNLIAHEMMHVIQKSPEVAMQDKNEREWQAYYEMLFHKQFPKIPNASVFHQKYFIEKALVYYHRSEKEAVPLRLKYENQKHEMEQLLQELSK